MTDIGEWQGGVGRSWADEHARTDRSFSRMTPHLLAAIHEEQARYVVDIGCGAGELSLALARARPDAAVTGVDVSADLVAAASARAAGLDNVRFAVADASTWQPEQAPDLYVSRHGVMFFPEPPAAFAHLSAIAAPGVQIVFSCFRTPRESLGERYRFAAAGIRRIRVKPIPDFSRSLCAGAVRVRRSRSCAHLPARVAGRDVHPGRFRLYRRSRT